MINYNPIDGDVYSKQIKYRPRTCFVMTKLGKSIPKEISNMRRTVVKHLKNSQFEIIDASSKVTGRDFLLKIYHLILSVPLGIALISEKLDSRTVANIFYEIGILQALGKEILIIKSKGFNMPSDFIRTEYIEYDNKFKDKINQYLKTYFELAEHYELLGCELIKDPITSIDYLRRSYLMTGENNIKNKIDKIISNLFNPEYFTEEIQNNIKNLITN